ncbi:hypothetical protein QT972_00295 [Microcoleus sp. herbarium7]|uniref:hypothetical protein n=1 Tax=Microcoleus sp. herbarium7 TaxID=3055435 RepID=UPI002FD468FE
MKKKAIFTGLASDAFKLRFNATDGRTLRRRAKRKQRIEAKKQAKLSSEEE